VTRAHPPRLLPLALACLALASSAVARAGTSDPNDPNAPLPLGPKRPCGLVVDVVPGMAFGFVDPSTPEDGNLYSDLPDCAKLCQRAGTSCTKFVKRAASCESQALKNRVSFNAKVNPSFAIDAEAEQAAIDTATDTALGECTAKADQCAGTCDAAP